MWALGPLLQAALCGPPSWKARMSISAARPRSLAGRTPGPARPRLFGAASMLEPLRRWSADNVLQALDGPPADVDTTWRPAVSDSPSMEARCPGGARRRAALLCLLARQRQASRLAATTGPSGKWDCRAGAGVPSGRTREKSAASRPPLKASGRPVATAWCGTWTAGTSRFPPRSLTWPRTMAASGSSPMTERSGRGVRRRHRGRWSATLTPVPSWQTGTASSVGVWTPLARRVRPAANGEWDRNRLRGMGVLAATRSRTKSGVRPRSRLARRSGRESCG